MHCVVRYVVVIGLLMHAACAQDDGLPRDMLSDIAWSFSEPVPSSGDELASRLVMYAKEIKSTVDTAALGRSLPTKFVDVRYVYYTQHSSGRWDKILQVVRVKSEGASLRYVDILFQVHRAAHVHLKDSDKKYFEGFVRLPQSFESGVPAYEVQLGS